MFSDTIKLSYNDGISPSGFSEIKTIRTGIAWGSDKKHKYKNPIQFSEEGKNDPIWDIFSTQPRGKSFDYNS
jgi:hypothetical protein